MKATGMHRTRKPHCRR